MRRKIDFALIYCVRDPTRGHNSTQQCHSDEFDSSAESWGRAGVDAVESESLSQLSEAL